MDDLDNQTEEVFQGGTTDQWRDYADSLQVSIPEISLKDATTFVASMTPVIGDAMAAKEVYDELKKVNPNYYLAGALGGATIVGLIPGIGDAAAKAIMNGAREVFDVAKRVKPKPNNKIDYGVSKTGVPQINMISDTPAGVYDKTVTQSAVDLMDEPAFGEGFTRRLEKVAQENSIGAGDTTFMPMQVYSELSDRVRSKDFKVVPSETKKVSSTDLPPAENSARTQIAGTLPTYKKADNLLTELAGDGKTLDFGAGLGLSKKELDFDTYEPFPKKDFNPDFTDPSDIPSESYKKLTNLNVLNVVPRDVRDTIVKDIGRILEPDGRAVITTRGRDVMSAKGKPGPENMSIITTKETYQKGFTQPELKLYIQETLGEGFDITNNKLGAAGVTVHKLPNKGYAEGGTIMDEQTRMAFALGGSVDLDTVPDNTKGIDPVSGNEVPIGSTPKEVRDDIPAQLSEGEYVVPSDVVRFYGVRFFENLRAKAKFGYQDMADNGRIGGEPVDEPDMDMMFDVSELDFEDDGEPMAMADGGYALSPGDEGYATAGALGLGSEGISAGYESAASTPSVEVRTYVNEAGHTIYITFIDGNPQTSIPPGYTLQAETTTDTTTSTATTTAQPEPQVVTPSSRDRRSRPMPAPKAINYKTLTTEEIANMLEDQSSAKSTAVAFGAGAINPVLGLFVKGAMMDSARRLENEIERRIASEDTSTSDKAILEGLLEASKKDKPGLITRVYGALKEEFFPETEAEVKALEIAKQMDAGEVYDFEGNIIGDAISPGDPEITGMDLEKTQSPVEVAENTIAPTTGNVSTFTDPKTGKETQFESYGQVTKFGVYAGDGFEWYATDIKSSDGSPVLGRRYTGEGEDNNLGQETIIATELGYGNIEDRDTFVKIAEVSMEEGSEFASSKGSANDGDWIDFITTGDFGASESFAAMKAKEANEKNDYSPTLTYGDALEEIKAPEVKVEELEVKVKEPEVTIKEPEVKDQDAEAQEILDLIENSETPVIENPAGEVFTKDAYDLLPYSTDANDPSQIKTTRLDMNLVDTITPEESKRLRDIRKAKEAETARLASLKAQKDAGNFATEAEIQVARDKNENIYGQQLAKTQDQKTRTEKMADYTKSQKIIQDRIKSGQFDSSGKARGGRAKGGLMKRTKKK
jgi:hypothetical protein